METKQYNVSLSRLSKIASEFKFHVEETQDGRPSIIVPSPKKVPLEEETVCYDTFAAKNGNVYVSAPAIPLPLKATFEGDDVRITVYPLTSDYGIIYRRQQVNFERNIRFFLHEIVHQAFHYTDQPQQIPHPLDK